MYEIRDRVLQEIVRQPHHRIAIERLERSFPDIPRSQLSDALGWLSSHKLIEATKGIGVGFLTAHATPDGVDFAETKTSVQELANRNVKGAIIQTQNNYNSCQGNVVNSLGDNNSFDQINPDPQLTELVKALKDNDEAEKAEQVVQMEKQKGFKATLEAVALWAVTNVLNPGARSAVETVIQQLA